jgi:sulfite reductase (NADPH) hemoprotein beta-component
VHEHGIERFRNDVEAEFAASAGEPLTLDKDEEARIRTYFAPPAYEKLPDEEPSLAQKLAEDADFRAWYERNVVAHKQPGYAIVNLSLKPIGLPPGDCTADQMDAIADLSDKYSMGQLRVTHRQNLVFADVRKKDLYALYRDCVKLNLATPNFGRITDIISCPGLDFCSLANARSIPVAERIAERFADIKRQNDIGDMHINISGCINACGHHHVAHLGILGVEKNGEEFYQVTLGGSSAEDADIGKIIGPAFSSEEIVDAVESMVDVYLAQRHPGERFLDTYRRVGQAPFKDRLYGTH